MKTCLQSTSPRLFTSRAALAAPAALAITVATFRHFICNKNYLLFIIMKYKNYYIHSFVNMPFQMACSSPKCSLQPLVMFQHFIRNKTYLLL